MSKAVTTKKKQKKASVSLADQVAQAVALLDQVAASVSVSKATLTQADRRKAVKMKTGGEKFVPVIANLAKRFNVNIGTHPVSTMTEKLQQVQDLQPLLKRAQLLVAQLSDASLKGSADCWDSATVLYGTLKRISRNNGDVQTTLAPVQEFFGRRAIAAGTSSTSKGATGPASAKSSAPTTPVLTETTPAASEPSPAPAAAAPSVTPAAHS